MKNVRYEPLVTFKPKCTGCCQRLGPFIIFAQCAVVWNNFRTITMPKKRRIFTTTYSCSLWATLPCAYFHSWFFPTLRSQKCEEKNKWIAQIILNCLVFTISNWSHQFQSTSTSMRRISSWFSMANKPLIAFHTKALFSFLNSFQFSDENDERQFTRDRLRAACTIMYLIVMAPNAWIDKSIDWNIIKLFFFHFLHFQFFISSESCLSQLGNEWKKKKNYNQKLNSCHFSLFIRRFEFTGIPLKVSMIGPHYFDDRCCHYSLFHYYNIEIRKIKRISIIEIKMNGCATWEVRIEFRTNSREWENNCSRKIKMGKKLHPRMTKCNSMRTNVTSQLHDCMNHLTGTNFVRKNYNEKRKIANNKIIKWRNSKWVWCVM